ncbi:MAG: hypothetical protein ACUVTZ_06410 [Armatimonadota bacterium]
MSNKHSCACCVSRRDCLRMLSAAALTAGFLGDAIAASARPAVESAAEFVDPAALRPKPRVRVLAAMLQQPAPYWLGWPGTAYDLAGHQKDHLRKLEESSRRLGIDVSVQSSPVQDEAGMTALINRVKAEKPDAMLVTIYHMNCWGWADRLSREAGAPLLIFAPIGTSFTGHVYSISRRPGVYLASTLEWSAVEDGLRMVRAKRMFEESRILWIHSDQRNETVLERLGTKVRAIPRRVFNERFDVTPVTEEVRHLASEMRRAAKKVVEPTQQDMLNCARAYVTAKRLLADEQSNALSMDCLGMVGARLVPTPPCGAWMWLQDQGITAGCEADLFGATSLMLTSYLLDRPGYMNDPVAETAKNLLITAHCTCGTRLRGFDKPRVPFILRNHSESALGVSVQVLWPVGEPVTLVRFNNPNEMIIDTGTVVSNVPTPPAGGCRTSIEIKMDNVEDCRDVMGFHQVVTLGNHRRVVEGFCQLYGIRIIHSPRFTQHGEGTA